MNRDLQSFVHVQRDLGFNMTPMIDVVFLLILFFMLTCQFIELENYRLFVPDHCPTAVMPDRQDAGAIVVSVFPRSLTETPRPSSDDAFSQVLYAVRSREYDPLAAPYRDDPALLFEDMRDQIDLEAGRKTVPLVYLRADKHLAYGDVQNVLLALSQAGIRTVQIAALRREQITGNLGDSLLQ